jgi:endoglucanase
VTAVAVAGAAIAAGVLTTGTASAGALSGTLYRDPNGQVVRWVAANPNDSRAAVIRDRIASQPQAHWMSGFNVNTVAAEVRSVVNAANALNQVPVLTAYGIPNRDCGGASAGGATSMPQYQQWIGQYAQGLGNRLVIIILETDSLALQDCLNSSDLQARNQAISTAVRTLKAANANAKVYLDGGHSTWQPVSVIAPRLIAAGVQYADGFFTNVANYRPLSNEIAFGRSLTAELAARGAPGKRQIIDTSRNGGATGAQGDWCGDDDTDRRIGRYPTLNTGDANVDGFLWIKRPGEADGCRYTPGTFLPDLAYSQASGVPNPPTPGTTPSSTRPSTPPSTPPSSTPTSPRPSSAPPAAGGACTAVYQTANSWQGGFQGQVTVTAGAAPISSWTVTWTLAGGQTISQVWSGTLSGSGSAVTVRNASWNGSLAARASTAFGFNATGTPSSPVVSCTAS